MLSSSIAFQIVRYPVNENYLDDKADHFPLLINKNSPLCQRNMIAKFDEAEGPT